MMQLSTQLGSYVDYRKIRRNILLNPTVIVSAPDKLDYFCCEEVVHGICWMDVVQPQVFIDRKTTRGIVKVDC